MIYLDHVIVRSYGGLTVGNALEFSGSGGGGGGPPKPPKAPVKKPSKKPKK